MKRNVGKVFGTGKNYANPMWDKGARVGVGGMV
jgi:hypothetical protein